MCRGSWGVRIRGRGGDGGGKRMRKCMSWGFGGAKRMGEGEMGG